MRLPPLLADDFFFNDTATTEIYTLSLHDALPISTGFGVTITVAPPVATQLAITTQPGGGVSGWPIPQQPVLELRGANNQPVAQSGVVVTASIASGPGVLAGTPSPPSAGRGKGALGPAGPSALAT